MLTTISSPVLMPAGRYVRRKDDPKPAEWRGGSIFTGHRQPDSGSQYTASRTHNRQSIMDLDKYRRPAPAQPGEAPATPSDNQTPEAPALGGSAESIRQKANRYHHFVHQEAEPVKLAAPNTLLPGISPAPTDATSATELLTIEVAKGNRFKSDLAPTTPRKHSVRPPTSSKKREPSPQTGVKIVYLDETMREEYIQIAGYLMVKHRIKLTMTAYFCFLHDQAVAQQSNENFLNTLVRFVKRDGGATTQ